MLKSMITGFERGGQSSRGPQMSSAITTISPMLYWDSHHSRSSSVTTGKSGGLRQVWQIGTMPLLRISLAQRYDTSNLCSHLEHSNSILGEL